MKKSATMSLILSLTLSLLMDLILDTYYWITTYVPIYSRRAWFVFTWDVLPVIRRALPRIGSSVLDALILISGMILSAILCLISLLVRIARICLDGWRFRSELLNEYR